MSGAFVDPRSGSGMTGDGGCRGRRVVAGRGRRLLAVAGNGGSRHPHCNQEFSRLLPLRPGDVLVVEEAEGQGEEDDDVCGHDEEAM